MRAQDRLVQYFKKCIVDTIIVKCYKICMPMCGEKFFLHPVHEWQRGDEALRASFVDRLPAKVVAEHFGYSLPYKHLLRYLFAHEKMDFPEPVP